MGRRGLSWQNLLPTKTKPDKRGPFTFLKDGKTRAENWEFLRQKREKLETLAEELRTSSIREAQQAATLVDAAIEAIDEAFVKLVTPEQ